MNYSLNEWHVLYVKHLHEKKIDSKVKSIAIKSFLPTYETMVNWSDRKKKLIKPLFPSYLFVKPKTKKELFKVLDFKGVYRYLKTNERYLTVKESEIQKIKNFLSIDEVSDISISNYEPILGEKATITYGTMYGLECKVLRKSNRSKVMVRIESLKKNIVAHVPIQFLEPVTQKITH
ncbi:MAG: antitermination protein NusG [Muricauda sp.]|nr:antitermination protein NusG [Allomuricauda sp.]